MKKKRCILWIALLFLCTLPMMATAAYFYNEVTTTLSSTGARPALTIEAASSELYYTRGATTTYAFTVKNSDTQGQGEVKLAYTLEFQMPVTSGVTYSLTKGSSAVTLKPDGVTAENRPIYKTAEQELGVSAQSDAWTLTMVNTTTRSASVLDTMKIIVHAQQAEK